MVGHGRRCLTEARLFKNYRVLLTYELIRNLVLRQLVRQIRLRLLAVDLARLREQLPDLGLMTLILRFQQQLPINHEPAIVVHNCYAVVGIQLVRLIDLPRSLKLKQIRNVHRIAAK